MKTVPTTSCLALGVAWIVTCAAAQSRHVQSLPTPQSSAIVFISGQVVISDGTPVTEPAVIQSICRGQKRTEARTDAQGNFSFQLGDGFSSAANAGLDLEAPSGNHSGTRSSTRIQDCELEASLAGFSSDAVPLGGRVSGTESADIGHIVLHRLENVEGLTISATTAAAPPAARKAFIKGQEQEKKREWEQAQKQFEKAVSLHPKFAVAWFELGTVQLRQNQIAAARKSFEQSIAADEKYVSPYHGLMQLAFEDQNWPEVITSTDRLLVLNPVNFPDAWFANAVGHLYLHNLVAAEASARRGLAIDSEHHVPKLEYLLGLVLLRRTNYAEATRHFQAYLQLATRPADIAEAQKQLQELARLSGSQGPSAELK